MGQPFDTGVRPASSMHYIALFQTAYRAMVSGDMACALSFVDCSNGAVHHADLFTENI